MLLVCFRGSRSGFRCSITGSPTGWAASRRPASARSSSWAGTLKDPVNLSIGQPHFDVPEPIKAAAKAAIDAATTATPSPRASPNCATSSSPTCRPASRARTATCSSPAAPAAACCWRCCATVNPGDEVIIFDPYFVMYPHLVTLAGGTLGRRRHLPGLPHRPGPGRGRDHAADQGDPAQQPGQPDRRGRPTRRRCATGRLARERGVLLISDEIYRAFCYDGPFAQPGGVRRERAGHRRLRQDLRHDRLAARLRPRPERLIEEMTKLQQFTFVCAPSMVQHAGVAALDFDVSRHRRRLRRKRDLAVRRGCAGTFEFALPGGAFYLFPKAPRGTGTEFVAEAIRTTCWSFPGTPSADTTRTSASATRRPTRSCGRGSRS